MLHSERESEAAVSRNVTKMMKNDGQFEIRSAFALYYFVARGDLSAASVLKEQFDVRGYTLCSFCGCKLN